MHSRAVSATIGLLLFAFPSLAAADTASELEAQIESLQARIVQLQEQLAALAHAANAAPQTDAAFSNAGAGAASCPALGRALYAGLRGDDVAALQRFLAAHGYFAADSLTGFFGSATEDAVKKWQAAHGVVSSGNHESTGWGVVGERTRAAIAEACGANFVSDTPSSVPVSVSISSDASFSGIAEKMGVSGANEPNAVSVSITNPRTGANASSGSSRAPVIQRLDAPVNLRVGEHGVWTVHVSAEGRSNADASFGYSVTWGDEGSAFEQIAAIAGGAHAQASGRFTHAYARAGTYSPAFTVSNDSGSASARAIVVVGNADASTASNASNESATPANADRSSSENNAGVSDSGASYGSSAGCVNNSCERSDTRLSETAAVPHQPIDFSNVTQPTDSSNVAAGSCTTGKGEPIPNGSALDYCQMAHGLGTNCLVAVNTRYVCQSGQWVQQGGGGAPGSTGSGAGANAACSDLERCTGASASDRNAQLANALSALKEALGVLLDLLGR